MRLCIQHKVDYLDERFSYRNFIHDVKRSLIVKLAEEMIQRSDDLIAVERDWRGDLLYSIELNFLSNIELERTLQHERYLERLKHQNYLTDDFGNEVAL